MNFSSALTITNAALALAVKDVSLGSLHPILPQSTGRYDVPEKYATFISISTQLNISYSGFSDRALRLNRECSRHPAMTRKPLPLFQPEGS